MKFFDKVTGNDMTKVLKSFETRVEKLPAEYSKAWEEIKTNIWPHTDLTGRNLIPIFDGVLNLLEEMATDGLSIEEALGKDIKGFCLDLVDDEGSKSYRNVWRKQLNHNIAKKLRK